MTTSKTFELKPFDPKVGHGFSISSSIVKNSASLDIHFEVAGDLKQLILPAPRESPSFQDELWKKTCFEVFISSSGSDDYIEWNFSPSGDWAIYFFEAYRKRSPVQQKMTPMISFEEKLGRCVLKASVDLLPNHLSQNLDIQLTAVLEHFPGKLSYWAISHGETKPDFHFRKAFQSL